MKDRQPGSILNGLNSRQSEMFPEFPPEGSFKPLKSISLEILRVSIGFLFLFFLVDKFSLACVFYKEPFGPCLNEAAK